MGGWTTQENRGHRGCGGDAEYHAFADRDALGADGTILYGLGQDGIWRVPAAGGTPEQVLLGGEGDILVNPRLLPGGDQVLLTRLRIGADPDVIVESLTTGERTVVVEGGADASYIPTGHLVYLVGDVLLGVSFDPNTRRVAGGAVPLVNGVASAGGATRASYAVADAGSLTYIEGAGGEFSTLAWVDRSGAVKPIPTDRLTHSDPRLSRDGTIVALHVQSPENDVWTYDLSRGTMTRQTFAPGQNETPVWSPDNNWLAYTGAEGNDFRLLRRPIAGGRDEERVWEAPGHFHIGDWTPNAQALVVDVQNDQTDWDIWLVPVDGNGAARPLLNARFNERSSRLSPDGRWPTYARSTSC